MDLLKLLPNLSLEQLLFIADRDHLQLSSRISPCLIRADLEREIIERDPGITLRIVFVGDPLGRQIALEAGVNVDLFNPDRRYRRNEQGQLIAQIRNWLRNLTRSEEFLADSALLSAVGALIYERKILVPEFLWWPLGSSIRWIFAMSRPNFQANFDLDGTPEDVLEYDCPQMSDNIIMIMLNRQTTQNLLKFAQRFPPNGTYFQTRIGILDYIYSNLRGNLEDKAWTWFREINKEFYPGREDLIYEFKENPNGSFIPSPYYSKQYSEKILSFPPFWFEEIYCSTLVNSPSNQREILTQKFPVLAPLTDLDWHSTGFASGIEQILFTALQSDPKIQPRNRIEMASLYRTKSWRRLSPEVVYRITGWVNTTDYYEILHFPIEEIGFLLMGDLSLCPNPQDNYLNPHQDFVITYGNFTNYVCYSPEELLESFQVRPEFVAFRKPNRPQEVFSNEEIDGLLFILGRQNPNWKPNYTERVQPLMEKIRAGLAIRSSVDLDMITEKFQELSDSDRLLAEKIFWDFFLAGMYQRTWDGVGPYPMRYEETQGSCLPEIEIKMTPVLNDIREQLDRMSPEGRNLLNGLSVIDYEDEFIRRSDPLLAFETQTREGNFCVGYGSSLMIYSGYFYLSALGINIPNFNLDLFEPNSTHR